MEGTSIATELLIMARVAAAWIVVLAVLGQPIGAAWCALACQRAEETSQTPTEHCRPASPPDAASSAHTMGAVSFCNHEVGVLATAERQQVLRAAPALMVTPTIPHLELDRSYAHAASRLQGTLGQRGVPLPLRM